MAPRGPEGKGLGARDPTLGDWDMKLPRGSASPLIEELEFRQIVLTENDEFLISFEMIIARHRTNGCYSDSWNSLPRVIMCGTDLVETGWGL
ncbi:hypothetical protein H5410_012977 [Solanum commersonii]|uniref:Uncharacterized protein n=1 Tax=Solanum commersonii TaxID=4109 RepID=A0A9J6AUD5_SOLCO|nr:hypothetical protein H5410_012977 [Solanum commersonii]